MTYPVQLQRRKRLFLAFYIPEFAAQAIAAYQLGYDQIPFIVVEQKSTRHKTTVIGCSWGAGQRGIESGFLLSDLTTLQRKELVIIPRNMEYEARILDDCAVIAGRYTPEYETVSEGECILNIEKTPLVKTGSIQSVIDIIGKMICEKTGLTEIRPGIARMRTLARMLARSEDWHGHICPDGKEGEWLRKADMIGLPDLDKDLARKMTAQGFSRLEHIHALNKRDIMKRFGNELGEWLYMLTQGYDLPFKPQKKLVFEFEKRLTEDINDDLMLREHLFEAADRVLHMLQGVGKYAKTMRIALGYSDGRWTDGCVGVDPPSDLIEEIGGRLYLAFTKLYTRRVALRTIIVSCAQFTTAQAFAQRSLFNEDKSRPQSRKEAINQVREAFGFKALSKGLYFRVAKDAKKRTLHSRNST